MSEPPIDVEKGHQWFAIEWNNASWDALEAEGLDSDSQSEALHRAHASVAHWREVGNEVNLARGLCLLANVEAAFGAPCSAVRFGDHAAKLAQGLHEGLADWDIAFIADAQARAAAAAWDEEQSRNNSDSDLATALKTKASGHWQAANQLGDAIADAEDQKFFKQWHQRGADHPAFVS